MALVGSSESVLGKVTLELHPKDELTVQRGEGANENLRMSPLADPTPSQAPLT